MDDILSAAAAGMVARLICHPLDTSKTVAFTGLAGTGTLMGTSHSPLSSVVSLLMRTEGAAGFYRGVGVATVGAAPGVALYLATYAQVSSILEEWLTGVSSVGTSGTGSPLLKSISYLSAGFVAEAVSCTIWVPIDVTKERLQSQPSSLVGRYRGSCDAFVTVYRHESLRGLYKGYFSTLASFGPFSAVYFFTFENCRAVLQQRFSQGPAADASLGWQSTVVPLATPFVAGGVGNMVASLLTNPLELIKTRMQVQRAVLTVDGVATPLTGFHYSYDGLTDGLRTIVRDEGWLALWRGCGSRMAFAVPNAALTMMLYTSFKQRWFGRE